MQTVGWKSLLFFADENGGRFLRIRTEDSDKQIFAHEMRTKNPEGIGMCAGEKRLQFINGHTGDFERAHARDYEFRAARQNVLRGFLSSVAASLCEARDRFTLQ